MDRKLPERLRDYAVRLDVLTPSELALYTDLVAAADLLEADGWVSVGECPAESGYYDAWVPGYGRYPNAYWWDEWLSDVASHSISPTHWRPLPTPPGGDHD